MGSFSQRLNMLRVFAFFVFKQYVALPSAKSS